VPGLVGGWLLEMRGVIPNFRFTLSMIRGYQVNRVDRTWTDYYYTVFKFLIGGGMVVGVTWLSRFVDPKYGGILIAAPIVTTIAFIFTYAENGAQTTQQLVFASLSFMIPTLLFVLALFLLMYRFSFVPSLIASYLIWITGVLVMNQWYG
jgi:uncharacterized membrane protein (GlpM family)